MAESEQTLGLPKQGVLPSLLHTSLPPTPLHLLIIQGALAAGSQLLSSGSGTLCSKLCHFFSCTGGGQEPECSEPRALLSLLFLQIS